MSKKLRIVLMMLLSIVLVFSLTACTQPEVDVSEVTLDKEAVVLTHIGQHEVLNATVNEDATDKTITWTSSDTDVVVVINGVLIAQNDGTATITAKAHNDTEATCEVTVTTNFAITNLDPIVTFTAVSGTKTLDPMLVVPFVNMPDWWHEFTYTIGDTTASPAMVTGGPMGTIPAVAAADTVAKVDHEGKITPLAKGATSIVVKSKYYYQTATGQTTYAPSQASFTITVLVQPDTNVSAYVGKFAGQGNNTWLGTTSTAETNEADAKAIRAKGTLELKADGTFTFTSTDIQRHNYSAAGGKITNGQPFNRTGKDATGADFGTATTMTFSGGGSWAAFDGVVVLLGQGNVKQELTFNDAKTQITNFKAAVQFNTTYAAQMNMPGNLMTLNKQ